MMSEDITDSLLAGVIIGLFFVLGFIVGVQ